MVAVLAVVAVRWEKKVLVKSDFSIGTRLYVEVVFVKEAVIRGMT